MKKLIVIIVLFSIVFLGFLNRNALAATVESILYQSPCETPKAYSIGTIDQRFNISRTDFLSATQEAAALWKNGQGEPLFVYDPEAKLTISLIYDERQYLNSQINNLNSQVEQQKEELKPEIAEYENRAAEFKRRNADLNSRISYWNDQGGAPEEEYNKLLDEQRALQKEAQALQNIAVSLNQSTDEYNTQIQELDQKVDNYNDTLETKPEEGLYIRDGRDERIEIYFNNTRAELIHTLAHEMGHAINMPHINNENAVMYPKTTEVTNLSPEDLTALAEICRKRNVAETLREEIALLAGDLRTIIGGLIQKAASSTQQ